MLNSILCGILLQDAAPQQEGGGLSMIIMLLLIFVIFYFFMIRPQNKRQKKIREERAKLDKGDRVITQGGILGKISEVKETEFVVEIAQGVKISVDKNCIYPAAQAAEVNNPQK